MNRTFLRKPAVPSFTLLALALAALPACGTKEKEKAEPVPKSPILRVESDRAALRSTENPGFATYDQESSQTFTKIFGGTRAADLVNYLDLRLHYYFDPSDNEIDFAPANLFDRGLGKNENSATKEGVVGAANIGTAAWISALVGRVSAKFIFHGQTIPIESSRVGIMMIGEGYETTVTTRSGQKFDLPPEYRQAILLHEARHSDCTGGISQAEISRLRESTSSDEMSRIAETMHCGHMHVKCPAGHDYEGIAACDSEAWGAYTVGEIFYRAVREDPGITRLNAAIADAVIVDLKTRTLVSRSGTPDMTSALDY